MEGSNAYLNWSVSLESATTICWVTWPTKFRDICEIFVSILIILALGYPHFLKPSVMLGLPIARSDSFREFPMLF